MSLLFNIFSKKLSEIFIYTELVSDDKFGLQIKIGSSGNGNLGENFILFNYRLKDRGYLFYTYGDWATNYFLLLKPSDKRYWNPLSPKDRKIMMAFRSFNGLVKYAKKHYPQFVK